jgi:tetratricopeptide (TPR) repeat protein
MKGTKFFLAVAFYLILLIASCINQAGAQEAKELSVNHDSSNGTKANQPVRDKWALVVGVGTFADPKVPRLKFATKDAQDFYNYLVHDANFARDHVRLLLDDKATRRRIMSELGSKFLARLAQPDDLIVLFFSTHGSPSQMDIRGRNYVVAYDSDPEDLFATGIEMQKILESIQNRVLSNRVLLVMDACHSGGADPNAKGMLRVGNFDAQALAEGSGQMVICSSLPDEQSWESRRYQNGVFTKQLLEGLRRAGNSAPLPKAFDQAQHLVETEVKEDHPGARQTPVLNSKWDGNDLIVAVKPSAPESIPPTVSADLEPDSSGLTPVGQDESPAATVASISGVESRTLEAKPKGSIRLTRSYFSNEADPRAAYQSMCQATDVNFNNPDFYFRKAKILIQMGNWAKAMQELKGVIVDDPNNSDYYLARALCFHKLGMEALAQADLRSAKFKNPTLPDDIEFGE